MDTVKTVAETIGEVLQAEENQKPEPIMQFFAYAHLPPHLSEISHHFAILAGHLIEALPRNAERTVALRKLLESKDAAVRARLAK